ncbi:MAG: cupin domain-containing protein [bacterium]
MSINNKHTHSEEEAILNSLGLLDGDELAQFKKDVENLTDEEKNIVSEFNNLVSYIPAQLTLTHQNLFPSIRVKERLFEKINSPRQTEEIDFNFIFDQSSEWKQHPEVEGIKVKELSNNKEKGYVMLLLQVAAGTKYPSHHHSGAEECYVISGDLHVEGKILGPGDFHHAESGSDHHPLYSENGCSVILVVDPQDY